MEESGQGTGEEKSRRKTSGGQATEDLLQDNQWTRKRRASSKQVQSEYQTYEDQRDKSGAMKTDKKKSTGRSR